MYLPSLGGLGRAINHSALPTSPRLRHVTQDYSIKTPSLLDALIGLDMDQLPKLSQSEIIQDLFIKVNWKDGLFPWR